MVVGPKVSKLTYLLDEVEIRGTVTSWNDPNQAEFGDGFGLTVDANYAHLPKLVGQSGTTFHCETYPIPADQINHDVPWPAPMKPSTEAFKVFIKSTGRSEL